MERSKLSVGDPYAGALRVRRLARVRSLRLCHAGPRLVGQNHPPGIISAHSISSIGRQWLK